MKRIVVALGLAGCGPRNVPIRASPTGAYVLVDEKYMGTAPMTLDYTSPGEIEIVYPGYAPHIVSTTNGSAEVTLIPVDTSSPRRSVSRVELRAWKLMAGALASAERGDCKGVVLASAPLAALAPDFHRRVFSREVSIARCMALRP